MRYGKVLSGLFGLAAATAASADLLAPGVYRLHNHPAGAMRMPEYGLRLDELYNVTSGHDVWTFDFDAEGSAMFLDYQIVDGEKVLHLYGTSYGGIDVGSQYDVNHRGFWEIDFTYNVGVETKPGDDDLWVVGTPQQRNYNNYGTIAPVNDGMGVGENEGYETRSLYDYAGSHAFTFRLGDENNDNGHRGFDGISGWGWVNYQAGGPHVVASDWLFTVGSPVPAPSAALLGVIGLAMLRRFRPRPRSE